MSAAQRLTHALSGAWRGAYGTARCPAHEDTSPSLSIADGVTGRVVLKCHAGCSYAAVSAALPGRVAGDWQPVASHVEVFAAKQAARDRALRASRQARDLWDAAEPIAGTLAETYLRSRGITAPLPPTLRYVADCWHMSAKRHPALLCNVTNVQGSAIHRTYVRSDGTGKADIAPDKAMLGPTKGGAVRLSRGSGKLVVAEGVETALSLLSGLYPGPHRVWAALSASGMAGLALPPTPGALVIASDGDAAGRDAAETLATRADALGWSVSLLPAPDGQDWNDVLRGGLL